MEDTPIRSGHFSPHQHRHVHLLPWIIKLVTLLCKPSRGPGLAKQSDQLYDPGEYNAAQALAASLPLLFSLTTGPRTDLLVLLDTSTDNSLQVVQDHARRRLATPFSQVIDRC